MGLERENIAITNEERGLLASAKGGHAVVAAVLPGADPIHKVTIVPRGQAMGVTRQLPETEKYIYEKKYMLDRLTVMMGGRAAEEVARGTATAGPRKTWSRRRCLHKDGARWGMSPRLARWPSGSPAKTFFWATDFGPAARVQRRDRARRRRGG